MSTQSDGEGLAEVFMKGIVFTLGAAVAGLVLRRVFRQEPEVVVVRVPDDEVSRADDDGGETGELDGGDEVEVEQGDLGEEYDA